MFSSLTEKFQNLFSRLGREKIFTEENLATAVREVRIALLEADVNYSVASSFIKRVKEKSLGESLLKSVSPGQQFMKIVHEELVQLMGTEEKLLDLKEKPAVILLCGLQGSGKTTQCAKLAHFLKKNHKKEKILLAACDLQRPAAVEQLKKLSSDVGAEVFSLEGEKEALLVAKKSLEKARKERFDVLIIDTAGRLHVDETLMQELETIRKETSPDEVLFVANATTGQDAVRVASEFDRRIQITGSILTMLDGDARAGSAISIREVTGKPLKFEGIGEKIEDFRIFNPKSMADRILGMGDVINLVRKAEENFDLEESKNLEKKFRDASFNYDDYLKQMSSLKKMGSLKSLMGMIPGISSFMKDFETPEKELKRVEAMILSMTPRERKEIDILDHERKKRISKGSGTTLDEVNQQVKKFKQFKQVFKKMSGMNASGLKDMLQGMKQMQQMGGKKPWH